MRRTTLCLVLGILGCAVVYAGPIPAKEIPAQAKWAIHFDVEEILQSPFGEPILEIANDPLVAPKLAAFSAMFGINLLADIQGITLWGFDNKDRQAAIYLQGKCDRAKLETIVRAAENYQETTYCGVKVHTWRDKGKNLYGCFLRDDLLVISENRSLVEAAIDAAQGRGGEFGLVPAGQKAFIAVACQGLSSMEINPQAAMLKCVQEGWGVLREDGGKLTAEICAKAENAEVAMQIKQTIEGFKALALLNGQQEPLLASLAETVVVTADGQNVRVAISCPKEKAMEMWRDGLKREMNKHQKIAPTPAGQGK